MVFDKDLCQTFLDCVQTVPGPRRTCHWPRLTKEVAKKSKINTFGILNRGEEEENRRGELDRTALVNLKCC